MTASNISVAPGVVAWTHARLAVAEFLTTLFGLDRVGGPGPGMCLGLGHACVTVEDPRPGHPAFGIELPALRAGGPEAGIPKASHDPDGNPVCVVGLRNRQAAAAERVAAPHRALSMQVAIKTEGLAGMVRFYSGLGLVPGRESETSVEFPLPGGSIEVFDAESLDPDWGESPIMPGFEVPDIGVSMQRFREISGDDGAGRYRIFARHWGTFAYVRDPAGNVWHMWQR